MQVSELIECIIDDAVSQVVFLQECLQPGGMEQAFGLQILDQKNQESILEEIIDASVRAGVDVSITCDGREGVGVIRGIGPSGYCHDELGFARARRKDSELEGSWRAGSESCNSRICHHGRK